jgi:hypothetical protein
MAYTVESAFTGFYDAINLDGDKRDIANSRRDHIQGILSKNFEIVESFSSGSIPRFTALKDHSDVDVIVALHYSKHIKGKTPAQVLQSVRGVLSEYKTTVRRNGQAVTLYYNSWPNVDVVPVARYVDVQGNITHYDVPNENTGLWVKSKPKIYSKNIEDKASECGYNFRRIVKMVKLWNMTHSNYLQSYHIEVLALKVFGGNIDATPWNVFQFFDKARPLLVNQLWHDVGYVDSYLTFADRQEVLKRFDTAISKSRDAWYQTHDKNNHEKAIIFWRQIFGDKFPAYG